LALNAVKTNEDRVRLSRDRSHSHARYSRRFSRPGLLLKRVGNKTIKDISLIRVTQSAKANWSCRLDHQA
jgi:hypothetical protein